MLEIRAITLDLDDTLWEIGPVIMRAEAELWHWLERHYPRIAGRWTSGRTIELRVKLASAEPECAHDFRYLRRKVLETIAIDCGYSAELVDPAFEVFDDARNCVDVFPDVVPALEILTRRFTVVAVTNGNADLGKIGIRHLFHDVVTAVSAGAPKPRAGIFAEAVDRTGVAPHEVLHAGDHPEIDIAGARDAGLRTAWVNRNGHDWPGHLQEPDAEVADIAGLCALLEPAMKRGDGTA